MLRQNLDRPWADLIDERYYDQSHLVRDFHRFMGMAPSAYFALPREMLEPAAIAWVAGVGQSLQGLQPPAPQGADTGRLKAATRCPSALLSLLRSRKRWG